MHKFINARRILSILIFTAVIPGYCFAQDNCTKIYGTGSPIMRLAPGSPGELGLVEVLANEFNKTHDSRL